MLQPYCFNSPTPPSRNAGTPVSDTGVMRNQHEDLFPLSRGNPMLTLRRPTQAEAVQALLESGADPNLQNLRGENAAHIAAREGNLEVQQPFRPIASIPGRSRQTGSFAWA